MPAAAHTQSSQFWAALAQPLPAPHVITPNEYYATTDPNYHILFGDRNYKHKIIPQQPKYVHAGTVMNVSDVLQY